MSLTVCVCVSVRSSPLLCTFESIQSHRAQSLTKTGDDSDDDDDKNDDEDVKRRKLNNTKYDHEIVCIFFSFSSS